MLKVFLPLVVYCGLGAALALPADNQVPLAQVGASTSATSIIPVVSRPAGLDGSPQSGTYKLQAAEPVICDPSVKQLSGYIDISPTKHLFYWFFEARRDPETAPLVLWLNGGPGASSLLGLLTELGPCTVAPGGETVERNSYSWNEVANIVFLDQPVGVGFSYADPLNFSLPVNSSEAAAADTYTFLQGFFDHFPQYATAPLHIAGESHGGMYVPALARTIHRKNAARRAEAATGGNPGIHINLASVILANGRTDPFSSARTVPDVACGGVFPVWDEGAPECEAMRAALPACLEILERCNERGEDAVCSNAKEVCWNTTMIPILKYGRNIYDARLACGPSQQPFCYPHFEWTNSWLNLPATKVALGVLPDARYEAVSMEVNAAFGLTGDSSRGRAGYLPELIEDGVRLLVYAGDADMACNYIGNEQWVGKLNTRFREEFVRAEKKPWFVPGQSSPAGWVRSAGGGGRTAGNVTFVQVHAAGHLAPMDQPEAMLDLVSRWLSDRSLA